jgi:hypothetical protein
MDNDSYTEISTESWFSRIADSIKGILVGFVLFIIAFPLLWWNEGRSVERYNSLKEGQGVVISVPADTVNPANNGKLIHTQGMATTEEILHDDVFLVAAPAIKLERAVSMYQWTESEKTETKENVGGSKTTKKTYSYSKEWRDSEMNSSHFNQSSGHQNPPMPYKSHTFQAQNVNVGAFQLNADQVKRISGAVDFSVQEAQNVPEYLANKKVTTTGAGFYLGDNPADPQLGDLQVSFKVVNPSNISIVAQQQGNNFSDYQTQAGSAINLLEMGLMDANAMFAEAHSENTMITWAIRIGGFLLMWMGLAMVLKPLAVLGAVLPFLGNLIAMGTGILSFLVSLPCTMLVIAVAWIAYRPLLAGILIAIAIGSVVAMKFMPRHSTNPAHA